MRLERADRVLVVAEIGLEFCIAESGVEIVGFNEQAFEQEVGGDAFVLNACGRGRPRRGRLSLGRFRRRRRLRDGRRGRGERRAEDAIAAANTPPNRSEDGADVEGGLHAAEWTSATTSDSI